jgi:hypothetical protein
METGDPEPATAEVVLTIGVNGRPRLLDLCERHGKALVEPLAALLLDVGQDVPGEPTTPAKRTGRSGGGEYPCLWCETVYGSYYGLSTHVRRDHGKTAAGMFGTTCPVCAEAYGSPSAVAVHGKTAHGSPNLAALFRMADREGDRHGVVRMVRDGGPPPPRKRTARKGTTARRSAD